MRLLEFLTELWGWLRIFFSFSAIGFIVGAIVYYNKRDTIGLIISVIIISVFFIIGIIVATKTWKKGGTMHALSRTAASPELDKKK